MDGAGGVGGESAAELMGGKTGKMGKNRDNSWYFFSGVLRKTLLVTGY